MNYQRAVKLVRGVFRAMAWLRAKWRALTAQGPHG